jgi:putative oxidoreductase
MRQTTAAFMLVWAVAKFANVKQQQGVASTFYGWKDASPEILMLIGGVQVVILLAFAAGFWKTCTYGTVFLMHAASVIAGVGKMIPPNGPGAAMTFWAGVPVLAGIAALWLLRDRDRMASVG